MGAGVCSSLECLGVPVYQTDCVVAAACMQQRERRSLSISMEIYALRNRKIDSQLST